MKVRSELTLVGEKLQAVNNMTATALDTCYEFALGQIEDVFTTTLTSFASSRFASDKLALQL